MIALGLALAALIVWLYLIAFHGAFWRLTERDAKLAPPDAAPATGVHVIAVVPARDEADVIAHSLGSLLRQKFSGRFDVILVDDDSSDGTSEAAAACAAALGASERLTILRTQDLAAGWTGKLAAMQRGFDAARAQSPDFVLFCDADIEFRDVVLERLVAGAQARGLVLASLMVKLRCDSAAERWFVPAFVFFFQMLYPFRRVNDPKSGVAAAAGGVMLVRPGPLAEAGGLAAIRDALIDDCALGALMKRRGPIWLGLTDDVFSLRAYPHIGDIERMVTRSAYAQLQFSPLRLVGALAGMGVVYLAPVLILAFGDSPAREIALVAFLLMAQAYLPSLRFYGLSRLYALGLPLVAAYYTWFTAKSAWLHWRGRGGAWKGRYQAPGEQRGETEGQAASS
jgi:hopene-associated glycosyltransferase HpnB